MIQDFEASLPPVIKLAYLPNYGMVRLRLTYVGEKAGVAEVDKRFTQLKEAVKEFLVTDRDEPMQEVVARLLVERQQTVSTAESCTGGYIAHLFTAIPGASGFYDGSVVSYANRIKTDLLSVEENSIQEQGAVSEQVVIQMAKGAIHELKTHFTIAVSGILGPDGGTPEKPVGTVWIAVGNAQHIETRLMHFRFDRERNMQMTALTALNMLRQFIISNH